MKDSRADFKLLSELQCRRTYDLVGWCLVIMVGLMMFVREPLEYLSSSIARQMSYTAGTVFGVLTDALVYLMLFIFPGCLFYVIAKKMSGRMEPIRTTPVMPAYFPLLIMAGLAAIFLASRVNYWFMCFITGTAPSEEFGYTKYIYDDDAVTMMILTVLAPAFAEEFLFRGVIYGNLRPYGRSAALIVSSLLFALMHQNASQTFYTFVAGLAMGLCYELSGSIWCSVFLHLFNNLHSVLCDVVIARFANKAGPFILFDYAVLCTLGIVSALWLIRILSKRREKSPNQADGFYTGYFGHLPRQLPPTPFYSAKNKVPSRFVFAPGMIVYMALTVTVTVVTALGFTVESLFR